MRPPDLLGQPASAYHLDSAMLVYQGARGQLYVTVHGVKKIDGRPVIGPGKPATAATMRGIARACGESAGLAGWIAPTLLFVAPGAIAWWRPPSPATMFFAAVPGKRKAHSGTASQPGLVFAVRENRWSVWAVAGNDRPTPTTPLYHAPHYNVWSDGRICVGNVELPKQLTPEMAAEYERLYFDSRFTHPNHQRICTGDPHRLWQDLIDDPAQPFPDARLVPTGQTLQDAIRNTPLGAHHDDED